MKKYIFITEIILASILFLGCPNHKFPPPYDCQAITTIAVTDPCTNSYPGLILNASGYNISIAGDTQFEWKVFLQKDTVNIDTTSQKAEIFYSKSRLTLSDTLIKNAPSIIVRISRPFSPCPKSYISLVKRATSNTYCPVWASRTL